MTGVREREHARAAVHQGAASPLGHPDPRSDPREEEGADLRLVPPALAAWAGAAVGLGVPGEWAALGAVAAVVVGSFLLVLTVRGRTRRGLGGAATVLFATAAAVAVASLHAADLHRGPLPELAATHARATVEATVTGDPRSTEPKSGAAATTSGFVVVPVEVRRVETRQQGATSARAPALLLVPRAEENGDAKGAAGPSADSARRTEADWLRLLPSTRIRAEAAVLPADSPSAGGRDLVALLRVSAQAPQSVAEPNPLQRFAGELRAGLREASADLGGAARGLLPGLVVGDTSRLDAELEAAFRTTDMTHLLAVSGSNLTVLLVLLMGRPSAAARAERGGLAPRLGLPLRQTALCAGLLTLFFVVVCRPDASVLRAAACGLVTVLALATGRRRSLLPALAAAVLALVLYDPWLARDFGFLLSVLATASLLTVAPGWGRALRRRGVPERLAEALAAAAAAQLVCAPVVAVLAAHLSLVAIPCNLLAEFAVAPATVLGFVALGLAPVTPVGAAAVAWVAKWPTEAIAGIARLGASLPGAEVDWPGSWAGAALLAGATLVGCLLVARVPALRGRWTAALGAVLLVVALVRPAPLVRPLTGWPPAGWTVAACDVGQGDALALATGRPGEAVLVDAGPEPEPVDACLDALGVRAVPVLYLSHFHADHVGGLPGVLNGRSVRAIRASPYADPPGQAAEVERTARAAGVPVSGGAAGEEYRVGEVRWRTLWPEPPPTGNGSGAVGAGAPPPPGPNDASLTLLVRVRGLTVLLPGDLEPTAQRRLLAAHPELPEVDVLKVAHHGSRYQDAGLLARLRPRVALVSAGSDNSYGHPAPETLRSLRAGGTLVARTDTQGALAVTTVGGRPAVTPERSPP